MSGSGKTEKASPSATGCVPFTGDRLRSCEGELRARESLVLRELKARRYNFPNRTQAVEGGHLSGRSKPSSFEEYWRASKGWQSRGLTLASARALTNAGVLTVEDLQSANCLELAMIPRIGAKSLAILYELKGEKVPDVAVLCSKAKRFRSMLGTGGIEALTQSVAPLTKRRAPGPVVPGLILPPHPLVPGHVPPKPLRHR
jgi:hypothetical protein